jgi:hypothetical protein
MSLVCVLMGKRGLLAFSAFILWCVFAPTSNTSSCSCGWAGPFLKVAGQCEWVIRARVKNYHGEARGIKLAMDVEVLEVLRGRMDKGGIRIWGGDGMLCRPEVTQFPIGTEWIFGLNGPGSKPAMTPDYAVSMCGQYWLQVVSGQVVGNIDDEEVQNASQRVPADEFLGWYYGKK